MVVAGTGLSLFSGLWMAVWCLWPGLSPLALFAPIALSSVGNGLSQPTALASALSVYPRVAGTASGLVGCSQMAVSALGTILVGMLPHGGPFAMVGVIVGTQIVACLFGALALRLPMPAAADAVAPQQAA
ncbi:MAG: hypothetical protein JO258_14275 [Alphaproteobacteria bacterium]|nr:hypothetical protein [Alphaproteobacteria bacterium]